MPLDVAALVDQLEPDSVGIRLVNLSGTETRNLIVQSGAFGEHQFTKVTYAEEAVYAFPWHGDRIPVPFQ